MKSDFPKLRWQTALSASAFVISPMLATAGDFEEPLSVPASQETVDDAAWEFGFRPYLWLTGLEGTIGVNGVYAPVDVDFGDIWDDLDFAWSSTFEARRGKWGVMLDFTYLKMSDNMLPTFSPPPAPPLAPSGFEMEMFLVDLVGSYRAAEWDRGFLDLTAGVRWMSIDNTIFLASAAGGAGSIGGDDNWFDPHVGLRAGYDLSERFYLQGLADVGGFGVGSDLTVQLLGGVGYKVTENVSLELAYRYLKEDYSDSSFSFDTEMSGPVLGLSINW